MSKLRRITKTQEREFRRHGYLLLRSVLSRAEVARLLAEVDRLVAKATLTETVLREPYYHENSFKLIRALRLTSAFDDLIDHPGYFRKLVSLMGSYIQLMGCEVFVRGPAHEAITGFHTDLGAGLQQILPDDTNAFLQIKVQLFLTDLSTRDNGNFAVIPGSHRVRVKESDPLCMIKDLKCKIGSDGALPPAAVQILAKPGDAILFPHSLWHAVGPNRRGKTRYSITLRYGQTALRPLERFDPVLTDISRILTERQRRVLGDFGGDDPSPYRPVNQDEIIYGS